MIPVFIGYDPREAIAYHVCSNSIIRHASNPVAICPLSLNLFKDYNETHSDGSNTFTYTRFLVPHLMQYNGWAIYIDGDMVLRDDIANLWKLCDSTKAVMVVKHSYETKATNKYLGAANENYPRKNWSSVILWNCAHPSNKLLTPEFIKNSTGNQLHRFTWLDDSLIGQLPVEWNWLPDEFGENSNARLLHYTLGIPGFIEFSNTSMNGVWHGEKVLTNYCSQ